jgi:hypothetical protein
MHAWEQIQQTIEYIEDHLDEEIKSATLSVILKTPDAVQTPYISNLKILIGGQ